MSNNHKATGVWSFHGREHEVNIDTSDDKLTVEVQDVDTADQWRASFLPKHIEDLTRKTGNFKHITVFVNMLESAVLKSSGSVTLDLLTYADLENLRQRRKPAAKPSPVTAMSSTMTVNQSKRYLILTYSSEFDRIHYPLALPYVGKPDPVELQDTIRHLQQELDKYKNKISHRTSSSSFVRLQKKYDQLLVEKEELERLLEDLQQEMAEECVLNGRGDDEASLRSLIRKLEESSIKEKTKYQRILSKKNEEIRALSAEVEDLKSSKRLLNSRVKSLTNELAMMRKQSPVIARSHSNKNMFYSRRQQQQSPHVTSSRGSGQRTLGIHHSSPSSIRVRGRSSSVENHIGRTQSAGSIRNRSRTPSPRTFQRFNPTAYVESKRRAQNEIDSRLRKTRSRSSSAGSISRYLPRNTSPSSYNAANHSRKINLGIRSRNSSAGSDRHSSRRTSSVESLNSDQGSIIYGGGPSRGNSLDTRGGKRFHQSNSSGTSKLQKTVRKKQRQNDSSQMDHSIEIKEIDARLNALQQYMKKSLERKR